MSKRSLGLLIEDIWESIEKIERYTEGMTQDSFQRDEKTTDAVVRNLEIIGEAAGRLPKELTDCIFRAIPAGDSRRSRPPIPIDSGHQFRRKPATDSGAFRPPL